MSFNLNEIIVENFRLSFADKRVIHGETAVSLTGKEYEILAALMECPGQVVLKNDLSTRLWPHKSVEDSNLFQHVRAVRKKLESFGPGRLVIETIPGRGYRLVTVVEAVTAAPEAMPAPPRLPEQPRRKPFFRWAAGGIALLLVAGGMFGIARRKSEVPAGASMVLTDPDTGRAARVVEQIPLASRPASVILNVARSELYVSENETNSVTIIDVHKNKVVARVAVGSKPFTFAASPDGRHIYIAEGGGGVGVIDTGSHAFRQFSNLKDPVLDIVMGAGGKNAYLALGFLGLGKLDLVSGAMTIISRAVYARALALTPDGRRLYVSYQAQGPGGSFGHDAIGYFDTAHDRFAGSLHGFANVGECLSASPDGSQVWENGADACDSPQYDHAGCPIAPGGLLNILSTGENRLVRAVGIRGARLGCVAFSPNGDYAAVATTDHMLLIRRKTLTMMASVALWTTGRIALAEDGRKAYISVDGPPAIAVVEVGLRMHVLRLTNREEPGHIVTLAILAGPEDAAKSIDPESLSLDGEPVRRTPGGSLAVSVETIHDHLGHSLVASFKVDAARTGQAMHLLGSTYSGIPVGATLDPF